MDYSALAITLWNTTRDYIASSLNNPFYLMFYMGLAYIHDCFRDRVPRSGDTIIGQVLMMVFRVVIIGVYCGVKATFLDLTSKPALKSA